MCLRAMWGGFSYQQNGCVCVRVLRRRFLSRNRRSQHPQLADVAHTQAHHQRNGYC